MNLLRSLLFALLAAGVAQAQDPVAKAPADQQPASYRQVPGLYPLDTCVVSGEELDADAVTVEAGGRTFKLCCEKCGAKIQKEPLKFVAKLDEALIARQKAHYPLKVCPVSGEELGSMGEPVALLLDGTLVQLCCKSCTKKATAGAEKIVKQVRDAAFAAQLATYPGKCVVSGEELDDEAVSIMVGTTLVRTCCKRCAAKVEKDAAKYMPKLVELYRAAHGEKGGHGEHGGKKDGKGEMPQDGECCAKTGGCECCAESKPVGARPAKTGGECCTTPPAPEKPKKIN